MKMNRFLMEDELFEIIEYFSEIGDPCGVAGFEDDFLAANNKFLETEC